MKKLIKNYTFNAAAKTVTFNDYAELQLEQVLLITNVTDNIIIYNFGSPTTGGSLAGNVLTLDYNTTTMDNADNLQVFMDVDDELAIADQIAQLDNQSILNEIRAAIQGVATARGVAGDLRVTVLGGGITISSGTVTTVTTVGNQTSMGGYLANNQIPSLMNQAAFQNINNVTRI